MSVTGTEYVKVRERGLAAWEPRSRTRAMLRDIKVVLDEYQAYWPLTVRQVGYRLLRLERYEKSREFFQRLGDVLSRGRRAGIIPWEAIRDDGVHRAGDGGMSGLGELQWLIEETAKSYRRDRQGGQPQHLEVWVEAAGMVPQVAAMVRDFSVPVLSSSGFDSVTAKRSISLEVVKRDVPTVIGVIGDFDPHGRAVIDSRADDVSQFVNDYRVLDPALHGSVEFVWLATRPDQIERLGLETTPHPKGKQSPGNGGTDEATVQAEAIDPPDLKRIVTEFVVGRIDHSILDRVMAEEEREQRRAVEVIKGLGLL